MNLGAGEIVDALESTAPNRRDRGRIDDPRTASDADIRLWRDALLRFLNEMEPFMCVDEIVAALEEY